MMYSNFNVKEFENLKERSEKVFSSLLENIKAIKTECSNMSNIVMSDDSNLGLRWQSLSDNMEAPITNVEDTEFERCYFKKMNDYSLDFLISYKCLSPDYKRMLEINEKINL